MIRTGVMHWCIGTFCRDKRRSLANQVRRPGEFRCPATRMGLQVLTADPAPPSGATINKQQPASHQLLSDPHSVPANSRTAPTEPGDCPRRTRGRRVVTPFRPVRNSVPTHRNPSPGLRNRRTVSENSVPTCRNSLPGRRNPVTPRENLVPTRRNPCSATRNPWQTRAKSVPTSRNSVPTTRNLLTDDP
jgi:hypothetical protein